MSSETQLYTLTLTGQHLLPIDESHFLQQVEGNESLLRAQLQRHRSKQSFRLTRDEFAVSCRVFLSPQFGNRIMQWP